MPAAPITDKKRIRTLDSLRGAAIFGILLMNVYMGGHPC